VGEFAGSLAGGREATAESAASDRDRAVRHVPTVEPDEAIPDLMHRLRNPLAALKAGVSLLRHGAPPDGNPLELLEQMAHEIGRLDAATRDTQRYFRLTSGRPESVGVAEAVRLAAAGLRADAACAGVEVGLEGDAGQTVIIDREQLLFSLAELIANARRHAGGRRVQVTWRAAGPGVVAIEVVDGGEGIPAEHAPSIGKPYFTTSPERTGLGLATVARVCRLAGGALGWSNVAGGGCRFTMELPTG
jgi:signal transduction histidine kinase